jgi:hypothetical protein
MPAAFNGSVTAARLKQKSGIGGRNGDFAAVSRARGVGVDSSARAALSCARGRKRLRPHPMRLGQAADEGYGALGFSRA